jgi:hypothetical protein
MKITQKDIDYFNNKKGIFDMPGFNEAANSANGIPSRVKWNIMSRVQSEKFGICNGKITMKMIKEVIQ